MLIKQLHQSIATGFWVRYWYSVELLRRFLLVLGAVAFPGNQASCPLLLAYYT